MSKYTDAYSATINAIAQNDPLFVLRDTLAQAKDAEKFIADAQAEVDKLKIEADNAEDSMAKAAKLVEEIRELWLINHNPLESNQADST